MCVFTRAHTHTRTRHRRYVVDHVVTGDAWDTGRCGPLVGLVGVSITPGDAIVAVNRRKFSPSWTLSQALANMAGQSVFVTVRKYSRREARKESGTRTF